MGVPAGSEVKNSPANSEDAGDWGLNPRWEKFHGEGNDNPLQYSCLETPRDRGDWRATVHGVAKSGTWPSTCTPNM